MSLLVISSNTFAKEVLYDCFQERMAQFFVNELENIAQSNATPVLLLNDKNQVVGVISVQPKRSSAYPHNTSNVEVNFLSLCAKLETSDFYYADDDSANLLKWVDNDKISISQDEGLIVLKTSLVRKESYATFYKVSFKAYDVFTDVDNSQSSNPDFIEDWGLPVGDGEFYFSIPKNWAL